MGYLVCRTWGVENEGHTDESFIFCDGPEAVNEINAMRKYMEFLNDDKTFTAQLCKIIQSTDPHHYRPWPMVILTFDQVKKTGKSWDASGITDPNNFKWYLANNIYYPLIG